MLFRFRNFPPTHFPLLILFPKMFYFSAHNGVFAVDRNPRIEFRLTRSIHYDAYEVCPKSNETVDIKSLLKNIEIYQSQSPSQ